MGTISVTPMVGEAATSAPFVQRYSTNANGAIISFGNTLMTCPTSAAQCALAKAGQASGSANDNNYFAMVFVDADSDSTTFNSSSSALAIPEGAQVLWAGAYWGARLTAGTSGNANNASTVTNNQFKLKPPGAPNYLTVSGTEMARNTSSYNAYQSFADVTNIVSQYGAGYYWGANVQAATGADRYAGWAITVVYTAPGLPLRNLSVFDGFNTVGSGVPQNITITGFRAPTAGTVDTQLTMIAYEGDISQTGDYTKLNNTQLATALSPGTNFMDSAIGLNGAVNTTRNPADRNLFGFDVKNIGASGAIPNGATSATFNFSSAGDVYYPGMVGLAINLYAPDLTSSTKTVVNTSRSGDTMPGDTLQYTLSYTNTGQDFAENVIVRDDLPPNVSFVPGSLVLLASPGTASAVALSDVAGDDAGEYIATGGAHSNGTVQVRFGRGCAATGTCAGGGELRIGDAAYIQFLVQVLPAASGTAVSNSSELAYTTHDTNISATYTTPPAAVNVGYMADVAITKTLTPQSGSNTAIAGEPGVTRLTVVNNGPTAAQGVVISDQLPSDYTATSWSYTLNGGGPQSCGSVPPTGGLAACSVGAMAVGDQVVVSIAGSLTASSTATSLSNVATVATSSYDPVMSNNIDSASLPLLMEADVAVTKTANPTHASPGEIITYTLTATNNGYSDARDVVISDVVANPSQLVLLSAVGGAGVTCPNTLPSTIQVQCTLDAALPPGASAFATVQAYIPANITQAITSTVTNSGGVNSSTFDPQQSNNTVSTTVTVDAPIYDLGLVKTASAPSVVAGTRLSYSMVVTNYGPADAPNVVMTDWLPDGLEADTLTIGSTDRGTCTTTVGTGSGDSTGAGITCNLGAMPGPKSPGDTNYAVAHITVSGVLVPADYSGGSFDNTASVPGTNEPPGDTHPNTGTSSPPTSVTRLFDLSVVKTADTTVVPGDGGTINYTMSVSNSGPSESDAALLSDILPAGLTLSSVPGGCTGVVGGTSFTCPVPEQMPGDTATWQVPVMVDWSGPSYGGAAPTTFTNTAELLTPGGGALGDANPANDTSSFTNAGAQADLRITKTSTGITAGDVTTYLIRIDNDGPSDAVDPVITDTIPAGLVIVSAGPMSCTISDQSVNCPQTMPGGYIAAGGTSTVMIQVRAAPDLAPGTSITNTATVSSATPDPTLTNNTASVTDITTQLVDVSVDLTMSVPDPTYTGGGSLRHVEMVFENYGPSTATNVVLHAGIAVDFEYDMSTIPSWCTALNRQLTCTLPMPLEPGDVITWFEFDLVIPPSQPAATFPTCAPHNSTCADPGGWVTLTADQPDSDLSNNQDSVALTIADPETDLAIDKQAQSSVTNTDGHLSFVGGATFAYTIDVWVAEGAADAANVVVTDTLPPELTLTQVNTPQGDCTITTNTSFNCALNTVPGTPVGEAPQKVRITVYGTVDPSLDVEQVPNTATVTSDTTNQDLSPYVSSTAYVDIVRYSDLSLNKLVDAPVSYAGNQVGYTLMAINNGPSDVLHGIITDTLPLGLTLNTALSPNCIVDSTLPNGQQVVVCAAGPLYDASDVAEGGRIPPNTSANVRIVTDTWPRDLRPLWCPGFDEVEGKICPEVEPPADLSTQYPRAITNEATVSAVAIDNDLSNNTASVDSILDWLADLAVTSSVSTTTPSAGTDISFTLTGVNNGPSAADDPVAEVTFPDGWRVMLPDGVTPCPDGDSISTGCVAVMSPGLNCEVRTVTARSGLPSQSIYCSGKRETFYVGSFMPGYTIPGVMTVRIPDDAPSGQYTIDGFTYSRSQTQCVAGDPHPAHAGTCESDYSNNNAPTTVYVNVVADTSIVKELVAPNPMLPGEQAVYKLTVTNAGPSVATNVVLSDMIPDHLTYLSGQLAGGAACPSPVVDPDGHQTLDCAAGTLAVGASISATLIFGVDPTAELSADSKFEGRLCNTGIVGSSALDPNSLNNECAACADVDTSVVTPPEPPPGNGSGLPNTGGDFAGASSPVVPATIVLPFSASLLGAVTSSSGKRRRKL